MTSWHAIQERQLLMFNDSIMMAKVVVSSARCRSVMKRVAVGRRSRRR
jgi:hypothetical protein